MRNYILNRLRIDSERVLALAENEGLLQHPGLKGRFRELLVDNLLLPWLPPYVTCGTGTIVDANGTLREYSQDDVVIYDKSLAPPVLISEHAPEGVFLFNNVILRIEVKSLANKKEIRKFVQASLELSKFFEFFKCITRKNRAVLADLISVQCAGIAYA